MASKSNAAAAFKRNLAALNLDDETEQAEPLAAPGATNLPLSNYAVKQIPFELLESNRFQEQLRPEGLADDKIQELAENIAINGFTSVILVRPHPSKPGYYEIGHGHRRLAALKHAITLDTEPNKVRGWTKIPARIADSATDAEWLDIAVSENLSREDLTPLAIANSFQAIRTQNPGISLAGIAKRVGRSKSWVQRYDSINGAPPYLIDLIREKPDSLEHLFILKGLKNTSQQQQLANQVRSGQLTLTALKEIVDGAKTNPSLPSKPKVTKPLSSNVLPGNSRVARLINQLEVNISYLNQQLEHDNYTVTFDEREKLEQLTAQLKELVSTVHAKAKKLT
ncbi:MAG TPA: ParB/RepB/Spo0J family partition protein [Chloroflexia bacterium]|nr:ParB/RepB/Spo0J family partition protein [Chloroflexia bacterium]